MGFLGDLFGNKNKETTQLEWNLLEEQSQLESINKASFEKPQVIFKHSTRCSISRMAWSQFSKAYASSEKQFDLYYLDLLEYRPISNEIANSYSINHQSPQVLLISKGKCVYDASHEMISFETIVDTIQSL